jgi:hypothetical protein
MDMQTSANSIATWAIIWSASLTCTFTPERTLWLKMILEIMGLL